MKHNVSNVLGHIHWRYARIIDDVLWLMTISSVFAAEVELSKYRASEDKTVCSILLELGSVEGVTDLLNQLQGSSAMAGVTGLISNISDVTPELILMGSNAGEVEKVLKR